MPAPLRPLAAALAAALALVAGGPPAAAAGPGDAPAASAAAPAVAQRAPRERPPRARRGKRAAEPRAASEAAPPPAEAPPAAGVRRSDRMEFDARLITGETPEAGAVYLFRRAPRALPPLVRLREGWLAEVVLPVLGPGHLAPAPPGPPR